ncbi:MAG: hypothetical protein WC531_00970 [Candidatus Paceibacterota bacterium]|jgi:hypothetical protein
MTKSKIITYVAVAVLILVGLYWAYHLMTQTPEPAMGGVVAVSGAGLGLSPDSQSAQLMSLLNDIKKIDLKDHQILNNKIFTTLQDFGKTIDDRVIGRSNPFASLTEGSGIIRSGNGGTVTSSTTQTTSSTTDDELLFE